jgi:hypothetical protein
MPHIPSDDVVLTDVNANGGGEDVVAREHRIQIKNRRIRYLEIHPEYFKQPSLELAGRRISLYLSFPFIGTQPIPRHRSITL